MLNPFFLQGSQSEQGLIQDLINEQLRMYGVDVHYIPRRYITERTVIKEVIESVFDNAYPIEAYVNSYEGYGDNTAILSKFGIQSTNELSLIISKERFETYITPLIKNIPNIKLADRPKEGDLIYFPLGDRLFEIKYVEHEQPFYQLQKNYVYELKCELFRYEDEVLDTSIDEIDDNIEKEGYIQTLNMVGIGSSALASTSLINRGLQFIRVTNGGSNYTSTPSVVISRPPTGGIQASAIARIGGGRITSVEIINPGIGYTIPPSISFVGGNGSGATATVGISTTGGIGPILVNRAGGKYVIPPLVTFSTPKHVGASATAIIDGPVVGMGVSVLSAVISIGSSAFLFPGGTTGGVFYKTAPTVTFSLPTGGGGVATATAILDDYNLTGGTVASISLLAEGKFYNPSSPPQVTISHPGYSYASATIGIAGSSINPSSLNFTSNGRAYRTAPVVSISTGGSYGLVPPTIPAVGIATINPITGVVTGVSFNPSDPWAVGTGATIGSGYTVAPNINFIGNPLPVQATATALVSVAGTITNISIGNSGYGYISPPTVYVESPSGENEQFRALGIATIRYNSVKTNGVIGIGSNIITGINTSNIIIGDRVRLAIGYNDFYNFIPTDTFVSGIGSSTITMSSSATNVAIANSIFEFGIDRCGIVTGIIITYGGGGYLSPPTVTISNNVSEKNYVEIIPGITTATGISTINSSGIVTGIYITNSGYGYVLPPSITVENASLVGMGTYIYNEVVVGTISSATARVRSWDNPNKKLEIATISGDFKANEVVIGQKSGAMYRIQSTNSNYDITTPYTDNDNIQFESDKIIDFTERNPFGMV